MGRGGEFFGVLSGRRHCQRRPPVPRGVKISHLLSETPDWRRTRWGSGSFLTLRITNTDGAPSSRAWCHELHALTSLRSHFASEGLRHEELEHFAQRQSDGKWPPWSSSSGRGLHTP